MIRSRSPTGCAHPGSASASAGSTSTRRRSSATRWRSRAGRDERRARAGAAQRIAFPQLLVCDDGAVRVVEVAARIPGGGWPTSRAIGLDLVEIALRQALGVEVPDELAYPASRSRCHSLPDRLSGPTVGRTPRTLERAGARARRTGGRSGRRVPRAGRRSGRFGSTATAGLRHRGCRHERRGARARGGNRRAARRGGRSARPGRPVSTLTGCGFHLRHYEELLEAAQAGGYRFAGFDRDMELAISSCATTSTCRSRQRCAWRALEADAAARATYFLMTERLLQPRLACGRAGARGTARARARRGLARRVAAGGTRRTLRPGCRLAQPGSRVHVRRGRRPGERHGAALLRPKLVPLGLQPALAARLPARGAGAWQVRAPAAPRPSGDRVYPGETMRESMLAMLDAERETRLTYLAHDRIDLL